ncbi:MAG: GNAT family N-acetyltransferase, partial [Gammaproteobacteria bacterium]|nr:GNAT family N-acetyltransferase [Gammaproteobacteria bacterium]
MPEFRTATENDLDNLLTWTQALMAHEQVSKELELQLAEDIQEQLRNWLDALLKSESALFILAETEDGTPMGCILGLVEFNANPFTIHTTHGVIQLVWVEPKYRKDGLASQLLQYMETTFKELNIDYMEISYADGNKEAEAFWNRQGYRSVSH